MLLNKCVNPEDEEGPGDIFEIAFNLQKTLMQCVNYFYSDILIIKCVLNNSKIYVYFI